MIVGLLCLFLGLAGALCTFLFTPLFSHWAFAFLIPVMALIYGIVLLALYVFVILIIGHATPLSKEVKKPRWGMYWAICQLIQIMFFFLRVTPHVVGKEKLPKDKRFLMVSNHLSMFDYLIIMGKLSKSRIIPIQKKEGENYHFAGRISHSTGFIPLDRENPVEGLRAIIRAINLIKSDECSIYIAPEGTRNKDGVVGEFHAGSFKIGQKPKAPIAVCCVYGTPKVSANFIRRRTHIYFDVLKVWNEEEVASMTTVEMAEASRHMIQKAYNGYLKKDDSNRHD